MNRKKIVVAYSYKRMLVAGRILKLNIIMKKKLKKGDVIKFVSGNYQGLHATVLDTDFESKDKRAMYGYLHTIELSNGEIGFIEKSEHWKYANETKS